MLRRALLAVLLSATVLAGCLSGGGEGPDGIGDAGAGPDDGLRATDETGVLRGVVVDEAIRPVAGVGITVSRPDAEAKATETGADGTFGLDGLAPGSYVVAAAKPGYFEQTAVAAVRAGEGQPPLVHMVLQRDDETVPYVEVVRYDGFIECGVRGGTGSVAACQFVNGRVNVTGERSQLKMAPRDGPAWTQVEMLWESTQPLADTMGFSLHLFHVDGSDAYMGNYPLNLGPSPLLLTVDGTGLGACATCVEPPLNMTAWEELWVTAFPGDLSAARPPEVCSPTGNPCTAGAGLVLEQRFDFFVHLFYRTTPPDGWRFSSDGPPPL
jgi:hypothetical protein